MSIMADGEKKIPLWGRPAVVPGTEDRAVLRAIPVQHALFTRAFYAETDFAQRDESKRGGAAAAAAVFHERRAALA